MRLSFLAIILGGVAMVGHVFHHATQTLARWKTCPTLNIANRAVYNQSGQHP
jgi:hypothetical protein